MEVHKGFNLQTTSRLKKKKFNFIVFGMQLFRKFKL
jgi:hypothetical protein